ncbi:MAG: hypothetical protein A2Z21_01970 [Candidatus Fraserbacteria bacterium RBG_16_55_9]|uniref:Uncharacterized protein n=1 Tax=Fraserbacteria sp. (strain RBG_16_55_9) TaxID=1817864 RepID=A0A1F5UQB0_FRAXR|nr:MAG: hypothetical protein A2Z21_01970 [Candidatus Fraserbacteria bacterium RBG_16_55_9]
MRSNKRNDQAHIAELRRNRETRRENASKGILTRAEALEIIARTVDPTILVKFEKHSSSHVRHAAAYKFDPAYREAWASKRGK